MEQSLTIYKASAGSGKTFTLAVEYIMQLLEPHAENEFVHTLAVTFTNKATAEMKSRILETLYGLKMGLEESKPYMEAIKKKVLDKVTRISEDLNLPFKLSVSIGYVIIDPDNNLGNEEYFRMADEAMYEMKQEAHKLY